jgi:hypothetical protein
MNGHALIRADIVGHMVASVYRSDWDEDPDGYAGCSVFVELTDGVVFELQANASIESVVPINRLEAPQSKLFGVDEAVALRCRGKTIRDVVVSEYWCGIGLLFEDGDLLFTGETVARRVGPCVANSRTTADFRVSEFRSYWC